MRYQTVDMVSDGLNNLATNLANIKALSESKLNILSGTKVGRLQSAALDVSIRLLRHYPKRGWDYPDVVVDEKSYPIEETIKVKKPFCRLMRFKRKDLPENAPKVLFIAAISGHHATLSRETFEEFLPDHEVFVTDWLDARHVPMEEGRFGLEEYINYVMEFIEAIGPKVHIIGICQAGIPGLVAVAQLSKNNPDIAPASMSFLASPMDIRINPGILTKVSKFINLNALTMFLLHRVPKRYPGKGRLVYPGMIQLGNFMSMSMKGHIESHARYFKNVYHKNYKEADKTRDFYDEYFSVLDSTAEFYIETLECVFIDQQLPKGMFSHKGEKVDCGDITNVPILTIEGAKDNMVKVGQCTAANDFCYKLSDEKKFTHVQEGVGHYGVFSGKRFRESIAPKLKEFIAKYN